MSLPARRAEPLSYLDHQRLYLELLVPPEVPTFSTFFYILCNSDPDSSTDSVIRGSVFSSPHDSSGPHRDPIPCHVRGPNPDPVSSPIPYLGDLGLVLLFCFTLN